MIKYARDRDPALDRWEGEGGTPVDDQLVEVRIPEWTWAVSARLASASVVARTLRVAASEVESCPLRKPGELEPVPRQMVDRVRFWLRRIPDLAAELELFVEPGSSRHGVGGSGSPARPPVNLAVVDLTDRRGKDDYEDRDRDRLQWSWLDGKDRLVTEGAARRRGVLPTLSLWVTRAAEGLDEAGIDFVPCCHRSGQDTVRHTVAGECGWLLEHAEWMLTKWQRIDRGDFAADVEWIYRDLESATGARPEFEPRCPVCGHPVDGQYAPGAAQARGPAWWRCGGCGRTWQRAAEIRRLFALQGMTLTECAQVLGKEASTLRRLKAEGRFMPVGRRGRTALYDVEIIRRALTRVRPAGRPRRAATRGADVTIGHSC